MMIMNSIQHLERCRVARKMAAKLIDARLEGDAAAAAFGELAREAADDLRQRPQLLVQQSRMIH